MFNKVRDFMNEKDFDKLVMKLRKLGYERDDEFNSTIEYDTILEADYNHKSLNNMVAISCKLVRVNFDYAAATGAIFKQCDFLSCKMYQPDFEFCNFEDCSIRTEEKIVSSFNNCNFINVIFDGVFFESCTFTGALFENCVFRNVTIKSSTLENALFENCVFESTNLRNINMDYVHMNNPHINGSVFPFSQIPYIFGFFQYLMSTNDLVLISSGKKQTISREKFLKDALPLLVNYWKEKSINRSEFYFPLSNFYIAQKDFPNAMTYLRAGLESAITTHDFRMIKFYCKLIAESNLFDYATLNRFYDMIKLLGSVSSNSKTELRSFMRNIGEIKSILFHSKKSPSLIIRFRTNLFVKESDKVGVILSKLFSIAKMDIYNPNKVETVLSENSPLLISLEITGIETNILNLFQLFIQNKCFISNNNCLPDSEHTNTLSNLFPKTYQQINEFSDYCLRNDIEIKMVEYILDNCPKANDFGFKPYGCFDIDNANISNFNLTATT